jgi:hypothetical protein
MVTPLGIVTNVLSWCQGFATLSKVHATLSKVHTTLYKLHMTLSKVHVALYNTCDT